MGNNLFKNMVYTQYQSNLFRHSDYWDSVRKGKYSDTYSELSNIDATTYYRMSKDIQKAKLGSLSNKYKQELTAATNFINSAKNQPLEGINETVNSISQQVAELFNSVFKSGEGLFYNQGKIKQNADQVKLSQNQINNGERLNTILNQLLQSNNNNNGIDLIKQFNSLIKESYANTNTAKEAFSYYSSKKGIVIENLVTKLVNAIYSKSGSGSKAIQTGGITNYKGESLGEDIMVMKDLNLDELGRLGTIQVSDSSLSEDEYRFLKSLQSFSIQVKSGINQKVFNQNNQIYKITLAELWHDKNLNLLKKLNRWNYGYEGIKHMGGTGSKRVKNSTVFFRDYVDSEELKAVATYALSKSNNVLNRLYRMNEYQVFWEPQDGFITVPEYFEKHKMYWVVASHKFGFDYRSGYERFSRNITLAQI